MHACCKLLYMLCHIIYTQNLHSLLSAYKYDKKKIKITTKNIFTLVITYHLFPYSIQSLYSPLNFNLLIHTTKLGTQN